jgi:hypothetical protein
MERNSLPTVPGTDNSHNRRRRPVTRHCRGTFYFLERSFRPYWRSRRRIVDRRERAEGDPTATPGFAEQQSTLTLAYKRTRTQWVRGSEEKEKSEDVSMGIILNFATGDVSGFDTFFDTLATRYYAKIAASNEVTIHFKGGIGGPFGNLIHGTLDRVTGTVDATTMELGKQDMISSDRYILQCSSGKSDEGRTGMPAAQYGACGNVISVGWLFGS